MHVRRVAAGMEGEVSGSAVGGEAMIKLKALYALLFATGWVLYTQKEAKKLTVALDIHAGSFDFASINEATIMPPNPWDVAPTYGGAEAVILGGKP